MVDGIGKISKYRRNCRDEALVWIALKTFEKMQKIWKFTLK